ncbi:MAG: sigma-70 family RNA polymerase sigma factor [Candidatus Eisenbacteria bacterium]|uniref:Sigma-70 family RNA polymerase sigma factor n=1 Tax=Eiseniibacteriota bacterium TaxID=2212470 RepID=A0A956SG38_UNCEI|nr:sigma-70 family RNA polymerase sigma factor [Candidatus Eisenbacteria bacterium]
MAESRAALIASLLHGATRGADVSDPETLESRPEVARRDRLYAEVYQELRDLAHRLMRRESASHTLRPTEIVHEAFLKISSGVEISWEGRSHFMGVAAMAMRHILVDYARRKSTEKRGGGMHRVTLHTAPAEDSEPVLEILALEKALARLESYNSRMARIVELRTFAGLTAREAADVLQVSKRTVDRELKLARLWLLREMGTGDQAS